ncbi:type II secretion system protein GspM [Gallaecimonas sp. GXIMD1310]|uniref:type II secretion system protein GspM n=1 Tax=Gallaecimonas sp. GXIMD1310 TaxID=3131926 RepID=UPI003250190E
MIKAYWQSLSERDQQVLRWAAPLIVLGLLYFALWQPLNGAIAEATQQLNSRQQDLQYLREQGGRILASRQGNDSQQQASLTDRVTRSAGALGISISRLQPGKNSVSVWVDEVAFDTFTQWVQRMEQQGLKVAVADLTTTKDSGKIRVRRLELVGA